MPQRGPESVDLSDTGRVPALHRAALIVAFAAMGVIGATIPASIPGAAARMGVGSETLLPGVSALFLGLFVGVVIVAAVRLPERTFLSAGLLLQCVGLALVAASATPALFFVSCAVCGIGFGLVEASATSLTRALAAQATAAHLVGLNGAAAVAAAVSPLFLVAFVPADQGIPLAVLCAVPLVGAGFAWFGLPRRSASRAAVGVRTSPAALRTLAVAGVALFFFVGAETVLSGWSSVLPQTVLGVPARQAALGTAVFWILVATGRFVCAALLRRGIAPERYLVAVLVSAGVLAAVAAIVREGVGAAVLAGASTFLIAPVYALLLGVALAHVRDGDAVPRVTGMLVAVGSAGGVLISFGVALGAGSAPTGVFLCVAGLLAVCVTLVVVDLRVRRRSPVR